jgi:hypothetical protein
MATMKAMATCGTKRIRAPTHRIASLQAVEAAMDVSNCTQPMATEKEEA